MAPCSKTSRDGGEEATAKTYSYQGLLDDTLQGRRRKVRAPDTLLQFMKGRHIGAQLKGASHPLQPSMAVEVQRVLARYVCSLRAVCREASRGLIGTCTS